MRLAPGAFKTLVTFDPLQAGAPTGQLFPASNGLLYGANTNGPSPANSGSIFVTTPHGGMKILDTNIFNSSPLTEASDGNIYGVAQFVLGGDFQVFRMIPNGRITPLYTLGPSEHPGGPLLQASDGNLYGGSVSSTATWEGCCTE